MLFRNYVLLLVGKLIKKITCRTCEAKKHLHVLFYCQAALLGDTIEIAALLVALQYVFLELQDDPCRWIVAFSCVPGQRLPH